MSLTDTTPYSQSYDGQCCQHLAEFSHQVCKKIRPLKKLNTLVNFIVLKAFALQKKIIFVYFY